MARLHNRMRTVTVTESVPRHLLAAAASALGLCAAYGSFVPEAHAAAAIRAPVENCPSLSDRSGSRIVSGLDGTEISTGVGQHCRHAADSAAYPPEPSRPTRRAASRAPRIDSGLALNSMAVGEQRVAFVPVATDSVAMAVQFEPESAAATHATRPVWTRAFAWLVGLAALVSVLVVGRERLAAAMQHRPLARHRLDGLGLAAAACDDDQPGAGVAALRLAFAGIEDATVITDRFGRIELANDAFARLAGATPQALHATDLSAIGWIADSLSTAPEWHPWRRAMDASRPWSIEALDFAPTGGQLARLAIRCVPIAADEDGIEGCIVTFIDCTASLAASERERAVQAEPSASRDAQHRERHDLLTGCLTRHAYFERMTQARLEALRNRRPLSCIALSVDAIGEIQAHHGDAVGRRLLQGIGETLRAATRGSDIIGRCGDDELTHLIERADLALDAARKAARARTPLLEMPASGPGSGTASRTEAAAARETPACGAPRPVV